jgi:hypothetical protein
MALGGTNVEVTPNMDEESGKDNTAAAEILR